MKFVTYLVTHHNDGSQVDPATREAILKKAWQTFGGYSLSGPMTGAWADGETLYQETVDRIEIACENARYPEARDWVLWAGKLLHQKAMYFEVQYCDGVEILEI